MTRNSRTATRSGRRAKPAAAAGKAARRPLPFFTIGHSTRSLEDFVAALQQHRVRLVVDVRTVPRSRANPQFNPDVLAPALAPHGIGYEHLAALGGLRGRQKQVPPEVNGFWQNRSFHNYADYATTAEFAAGLAALRKLGHRRRCAVMCAEAVWWRCHRRIIADYLLAAGEPVLHIMGQDRAEPATRTPAAKRRRDGTLVYPPAN